MHSTGIAAVVLLSILTASSNHPPRHALPKNLREQWVADLNLALKNARRPAAFAAAMTRPRQFSAVYRMNPMAARTAEVAGYSLFLQQRHAEATVEYVHAKALGEAIPELRTVAGAANALSNIHLIAGNIPGALEAARQAVSVELPESPPAFVASLKNHYARMLARSGRFDEATRVFTEVIEFSEMEGLTGPRADSWKLIGRELMLRGELGAAERARLLLRERDGGGRPASARRQHRGRDHRCGRSRRRDRCQTGRPDLHRRRRRRRGRRATPRLGLGPLGQQAG